MNRSGISQAAMKSLETALMKLGFDPLVVHKVSHRQFAFREVREFP
jgi:hypothetical protein